MPLSSVSKLVLTALFAAVPIMAGQKVNAVWSTGDFETISGPDGNEIGHSNGFSLLDESGNAIWSASYPNDQAPCELDGYTFKLSGGCLDHAEYSFKCSSDEGGDPKNCEVINGHGGSLGTADGSTSTDFFGVGIAIKGKCGMGFELADGVTCGKDDSGMRSS